LNTFKQGAVTQLARNVDQNRLALLAQSANAEVVAMIRSQVNGDASSKIFEKFRGVFPGFSPAQSINTDIVLFSGFEPEQTLQMAQSAGYPLKIRSKAVLRVYRQCEFASVSAFNAYLDVFSQAYREGNEDNVIEVHERRDVRLVDVRHTLDKYVLFVKNYSPDYNNTTRRIIVQGITPSGPHMSRVYLGNDNYPTCLDEQKNIWLDLNYAEHKNAPGFAALFNFSKLTDFPGSDASDTLFMKASVPFKELKDSKNNYLSEAYVSSFVNVPAVKKIYVKFVNDAADGCNGQVTPAKVGTELKTKCSQAMPKSNSNAASYQICDDYVKKSKDTDYSACTGFQKILRTCMDEWKLHYGYLDAANVWQIENIERPALPPAKSWVTALAFKGLTYLADENAKKGPYFYAYLNKLPDTQDGAAGKVYNPERLRVGKMLQLYGEANDTPVVVEGPVYLRFFKLAFFDTFEKEITFFEKPRKVIPEPVPIPFVRPLLDPGTFQNLALANNFSPTPYFSDSMMMSRAIDNVSVNALLGDTLEYYSWEGKPVTINPLTAERPTFAYPRQRPSASPVKAKNFGRLIDFKTVSYNYSSPGEFLAERTSGTAPNKTLFIDGAMYIEAGDLDLTEVSKFYGKGLIYL
ncbi:MAG TPA: hypothetical protein PLM07_01665, partial [Candidatus Rifleibacterium sp.]|nr:hypothetical protein [Candidatus Rifleibacterium sp.]